MKPVSTSLIEKLRKIKLLVLDVDGILSDGRIYITSSGEEIKAFDARDGLAVVALLRRGIEVAVISGRYSKPVEIRCGELGIKHVYQEVSDKKRILKELSESLKVSPEEIACMGDDINDIAMMTFAGVCATVPEAHPAVRRIAHYITENPGGRGAVREFAELIMKAQGLWKY